MNPYGASILDNAVLPQSHGAARQLTAAEEEQQWLSWRNEAMGKRVRITTDQEILDRYYANACSMFPAERNVRAVQGEVMTIVEVPRHFTADERGEIQHLIGGGPIAQKPNGERVGLGTGCSWEFVP
jgi:hypothetical protein